MIVATILVLLATNIIAGIGGSAGHDISPIHFVLTLISVLLAASALWITVQHKLESAKPDKYCLIAAVSFLGIVILWTAVGQPESVSAVPSFVATAVMSLYVSRIALRKKQMSE